MPSQRPNIKKNSASRNESSLKRTFTSGAEIRQALRVTEPQVLLETLTSLRNQLTVHPEEGPVAPEDARLNLVQQWLQISPECEDMFSLLKNDSQTPVIALTVTILACLVNLTSTHYIYHSLARPIIKKLLSTQWIRKLNRYVSGSHKELSLATLKLLNAISTFASGAEQRTLFDAFIWDVKLLNRLLFMKHRGRIGPDRNLFQKPDIRTLTMLYILSFFSPSSSSYVKSAFLEQHRDAFFCIFKGLHDDPYSVIKHVLETCWTGIWQDQKLKRTVKVSLFNETTLQQISRLYERAEQEGPDPDDTPANLVHHYLLGICTHSGIGICFRDRGWYPRQDDDITDTTNQEHLGNGKVYNKILRNFLKTLKVGEDGRQQELALKILSACPELLASYWQSSPLTLEPRLTSKWLSSIAFLGSVISLPLPTQSFLLSPSDPSSSKLPAAYQPTPPPLSIVMENIIPSMNFKIHISKGLQSLSPLVQHSSAVLLAKCLAKCEAVLNAFKSISVALEESEIDGQWARRVNEVYKEVRRRIPDFQVVVAFAQPRPDPQTVEERIRNSLLMEISHRLLWSYHCCVPSLVSEARYDVGKLLQSFITASETQQQSQHEATAAGFERVQYLHVLRILRQSDQFNWSHKTGGHSHLHSLLSVYLNTPVPIFRTALGSLLGHLLSDSLLFQHDKDELSLWLETIPSGTRLSGSEAPDGTPLSNEGEAIVTFLEECIHRCTKVPYRYLDEMSTYFGDSGVPVSPLLMTALEQLDVKCKNSSLSPSQALSIFTYLRILIVKLMQKVFGNTFGRAMVSKFNAMVANHGTVSISSDICAAINRELGILGSYVDRLDGTLDQGERTMSHSNDILSAPNIDIFLKKVEQTASQEGVPQPMRKAHAYELIDWMRLGVTITTEQARKVMGLIEKFDKDTISLFHYFVDPRDDILWPNLLTRHVPTGDFDILFLNCSSSHLRSSQHQHILLAAIRKTHHLYTLKRYLCLISHRISAAYQGVYTSALELAAELMAWAKSCLPIYEYESLQSFAFHDCLELRNLFYLRCADNTIVQAIAQFLAVVVNPEVAGHRSLISAISKHWHSVLLEQFTDETIQSATPWVKYMSEVDILVLLDKIFSGNHSLTSFLQQNREFSSNLIGHLRIRPSSRIAHWIRQNLVPLLSLQNEVNLEEHMYLQQAIEDGATLSLPIGYNCVTSQLPQPLSSAIAQAELHWVFSAPTTHPDLRKLDISLLLSRRWTEHARSTISGLLYQSQSARDAFWNWLPTLDPAEGEFGPLYIATPLLSAIDITLILNQHEIVSQPQGQALSLLFENGIGELISPHSTPGQKDQLVSLLQRIFAISPSTRLRMFQRLLATIDLSSLNHSAQYVFTLTSQLCHLVHRDEASKARSVVDVGLQWVTRRLSEKSLLNSVEEMAIKQLTKLISDLKYAPAYLCDPALSVIISRFLHNTEAIYCAETILSYSPLKPASLNKHLQNVINHPQFTAMASPSSTDTPTRNALVKLLNTLFRSRPANTCQDTHMPPLVFLYGGTLSLADRQLLGIFRLFEHQRKISAVSLLSTWSGSASAIASNCFEAICTMDPMKLFRTALHFPLDYTFLLDASTPVQSFDEHTYDPVFILLLLSQLVAEGFPTTSLMLLEFFKTNIVCVAVRALSSSDVRFRQIARAQLNCIQKLLQAVDMQEGGQILYVLDLLRNLIPSSSNERPLRSYTTLIAVHAIRGIFNPSNFIYPITSRFLLQRPELDDGDVPLLYGMLYSNSDDWKKQRAWIIKFIGDGLNSEQDWDIMKTRHTWDLLASIFQFSRQDIAMRQIILEVLLNITSHRRPLMSLILKSSVLQWIENQLADFNPGETLTWIKILENIVVIIDGLRAESATRGEWRLCLLRCITKTLQHADLSMLYLIGRSVLRLSLLQGFPSLDCSGCCANAISRLKSLESADTFHLPVNYQAPHNPNEVLPPHRSHNLNRLLDGDDFFYWGRAVEYLWQVTMASEAKSTAWNVLSCRVLVWRGVVGAENSPIGEWIRRQSLKCINVVVT